MHPASIFDHDFQQHVFQDLYPSSRQCDGCCTEDVFAGIGRWDGWETDDEGLGVLQ
jgi:hypothetical protein